MKEPLYRWVCTLCGISDEAESSELARLNIDVHMRLAHPSTRGPVRVQVDPNRDVLVLDDEAAGSPADEEDDRGGHA
jgi:hypothetical protein